MLLTVNEIQGMVKEKAERNKETYKQLLQMCYNKIKRAVDKDRRTKSLTFVLPPFLLGQPLYNMAHAVRYIIEKLERGGFTASPVLQNGIFIEWGKKPDKPKKKSKKPRAEEAPSVQAFTQSAQRFLT